MKKIKLDHASAERVRSGLQKNTWRLYDDKDLRVNDDVMFVDKVKDKRPETWVDFGPFTINRVTEKQLGDLESSDFDNSKSMHSPEASIETLKKRYGPQVGPHTAIKIIHFEPKHIERTPRELVQDKFVVSKTTRTAEAKLYADGGSRGNPGPSASGYVILTTNEKILIQKGVYLGVTTNNQAEYQALKLGLEDAFKAGITTLHVYMDSLLVINQMLGVFKVKNRDLWPIHDAAKHLAQQFRHISFTHVPRELNKRADRIVNEVLNEAERQVESDMV